MQNVLQVNLTINCTLYTLYTKINSDFKVKKADVIISQIYGFDLQPVI